MFPSPYRQTIRRVALSAMAVLWLTAAPSGAQIPLPVDDRDALRGREERARVARVLSEEISAVLRQLGTSAAAERDAVGAELAAIARLSEAAAVNARAQQLYASARFQHLRLTNTLTVVREALTCAATEENHLMREMACWAIAATYLSDQPLYEEAVQLLARSGRLGYAGGMTPSRWAARPAQWSRYGRAIQDYITIPFLRGDLDRRPD